MPNTPKIDKPTPGEHAREVMNDLLKKHTVCGELIIGDTTKEEFLARHPATQCAIDLKGKKPGDKLETIHDAIEKQAQREIRGRGKKAMQAFCAPDEPDEARALYYRATDEVIGHINKKDWGSGQNAICDAATKAKRHTFATAPKELVPDHGLVCEPEGGSISRASYCRKPEKTR